MPHKYKVLVVGDLIVDEYWTCDVDRISPEAPVPVASLLSKECVIGGAGNVARNLVHMSDKISVHMCGLIGNGYKYLLREEGIDLRCCDNVPTEQTNIKLRIVHKSTGQHIVRVDNEKSAGVLGKCIEYENVIKTLKEVEPDAVIISDYCKGAISEETASIIIDYGIASGQYLTYVDSRKKSFDCFRYAECITPNMKEFNLLSEYHGISTPYELMGKLDVMSVLLTRSEDGMELYRSKKNLIHVDSTNKHITDVTGAGDTCIAAYTISKLLAPNANPELWIEIANKLAGEVCMKLGTQVPDTKVDNLIK